MYKHILIPTDGFALADKAVEQGTALAKRIGAKITAKATTEKPRLRWAGSNVSSTIDCWLGCMPPPKNPCANRNSTSCGIEVAIPHRNEKPVNAAMHSKK